MLLGHIEALCSNISATFSKEDQDQDQNQREPRVLDMARQFDYFAFDVICEVVFGMRYNTLKQKTHRFVLAALEESNVRISTLVQASAVSFGNFDKLLFPRSIDARNKFLGFLGSLLKSRSKAYKPLAEDTSVFTHLESAKDSDGRTLLSKAEIRAESATLIVAGKLLSLCQPVLSEYGERKPMRKISLTADQIRP